MNETNGNNMKKGVWTHPFFMTHTDMQNKIHFISLGPGHHDMMTIAALKALEKADIIYCPATSKGSRAAQLLHAAGIDRNKTKTYLLPMLKDRDAAYAIYDQVCEEALGLYGKGLDIAITAEGDAGLYSSTAYMSQKMQEKRAETIHIAGIPAFIAAAASAGIPVAEQEETVKIFPGTATAASLCEAAANGTAIVMKVSQCADEIRKAIAMTGDRCTWHYFENVGTEDEFHSTDPEEILSRKMPYFSLLIIKRRQA